MKNKLLYFLIASIALIFTSCTNDENNNDVSLMLPKKITYSNGEKIYQTTTFTYDGNKIVNISSENIYIDFVYDGNKIVKEIQSRNFGESYTEKLYGYSNDSLKTVVKLINGKETRYVYIDNHDGTIKKNIYTTDRETGKLSENYSTSILMFENGNLIQSVSDWGDEPYITTYRCYYDLKNNAFKNISGLNLLLDQADFSSEESYSSLNNINKYWASTRYKSEIGSDPYEGIIFEPYAGRSDYEYNKKGYPTKKTSYNEGGSVNEIIEYTY